MAVATTSDFTVTARKVIERGLRMVGGLGGGASASASQMNDGKLILNSIIREWDLRRAGLWVLKEATLTTIAGVATYTSANGLATDIFRMVSGVYQPNSNDEFQVDIAGYDTYDKINDKSSTGDPVIAFLSEDTDVSTRTLKLWPVPNQSKPFRYRYRRFTFDFDDDSNNPDFPAAWFGALAWAFASEVCEEYNIEDAKAQRLQTMAEKKIRDMKAGSVKSTTNPQEKDTQYF